MNGQTVSNQSKTICFGKLLKIVLAVGVSLVKRKAALSEKETDQ